MLIATPLTALLTLASGLVVLACGTESSDAAEALPSTAALPETVFERERLLTVDIELAEEDWQALRHDGRSMEQILRTPSVPFDYERFSADVVVGGVPHARASVRKKGFIGSLSVLRPSLKLSFAEPIDAAGTTRLTLNNDVQDRSHARQCMAYELFSRAGIPAPRCSYARVRVNGAELGVYTNVEPIGTPMLERHFERSDGPLWEGTLADFELEGVETIEAKNKSADDRAPLLAVVDALSQGDAEVVAALSQVLDLPRFRDFWAIETLLGHWDGYSGNANNYYVYFDPGAERLSFIPWGTDQAFVGAIPFPPAGYVFEPTVYAAGAIARRLYAHPAERAAFRERLGELNEQLWRVDAMLAEVDTIASVAADADPEALDAHEAYIERRQNELQDELSRPAPELDAPSEPPGASACSDLTGSIRVEFSTTWGTIGTEGGTIQTELTLDGTPVNVALQGSAGPDPANPRASILLMAGLLPSGTSLLMGLVTPTELVVPGVHPFHSFESFVFVSVGPNPVGTVGDGDIIFDTATRVPGSTLTGNLTGRLYQTACAQP